MLEEKDGKRIVNVYKIFCEHISDRRYVGKGERGSATFFHCEFPHDVNVHFRHDDHWIYKLHESINEYTGQRNWNVFQLPGFRVNMSYRKLDDFQRNPLTILLDMKGGIRDIARQGGCSCWDS